MAALPSPVTSVTSLIRESSPPSGTPASPVHQYLGSGQLEVVQGRNGGIYVIAAGTDGSAYREFLVDSAGRPLCKITDGTNDLALNSDGSVNVRSSESVGNYLQAYSTTLIPPGSETITITPAAGYIAELIFIGFTCPAYGGAGDYHRLDVSVVDSLYIVQRAISWQAAGDQKLLVQNNMVMGNGFVVNTDDGSAVTMDYVAQQFAVRGQVFDNAHPLIVKYSINGISDNAQTRLYNVVYRLKKVA